MFFYQFMHSSESILGVWENFHSIHPSAVYTFFQQEPFALIGEKKFCSKKSRQLFSFQKRVGFLVNQSIFIYFYLLNYYIMCFSFSF